MPKFPETMAEELEEVAEGLQASAVRVFVIAPHVAATVWRDFAEVCQAQAVPADWPLRCYVILAWGMFVKWWIAEACEAYATPA